MATTPLNDSRIKKLIAETEKALILGKGTAQRSTSDGHGLTLRLEASGAWYWVRRYARLNGKRNNLPLGKYPDTSLAKARELCDAAY